MKSRRLPAPLTPLHRDFVGALRRAWETQHTRAAFVGALYWETEDGRVYCPPSRDMKRLQRLADTLNYDGPIFDEGRTPS
jgi:hypothetical protein